MAWFKRTRKPIPADTEKTARVPEGLWIKCPGCARILYNKDLAQNLSVCPKCAHHFRLTAADRLRTLFDEAWTEYDSGLTSTDPLGFNDTKPYRERLKSGFAATGLRDAVIIASGRLDGIDTIVGAMDFGFIGGSMGVVVGEKIARGIERAIAARQPVIIVSCSGGARMMEGALSLMQMAKVSAALAQLARAGLPFISVLADPTTGGVTASFAMLGDLNIAEPKALIGFAGARVIEQTIRQKLPPGFQRAEFLLDHGFLDMIVDRRELKSTLAAALRFMSPDQSAGESARLNRGSRGDGEVAADSAPGASA
jgi:acetyl-CoA carboxylase carboxyl transferase subunit beta